MRNIQFVLIAIILSQIIAPSLTSQDLHVKIVPSTHHWIQSNYHEGIECLALAGKSIFAGGESGRVLLSADDGTSWTQINIGLMNIDVLALAVNGINLFAGTTSGVFLSTNKGTTWTHPILA